jgi:hypothetical protein
MMHAMESETTVFFVITANAMARTTGTIEIQPILSSQSQTVRVFIS